MANTYTQLYIQFVFAVENRISLIQQTWEDELYKYMTGITQNHKHKMIAINGISNHVHVFIGLDPLQSISSYMQTLKGESSEWINIKKFTPGKFQWQSGYGAFSYSKSQINDVYHYIMKQKEHHKKQTFLEEYKHFLKKFEVEYKDEFLFHEIT